MIYLDVSRRRSAEVYCEQHGWIEVPDCGCEVGCWTKQWADVVAAVNAHLAAEHPEEPDEAP